MTSKPAKSELSESSTVVAAAEQISSDLGGEAVILNLKSGVYHGLNEMGAQVWNLIQQPKVVKDIKQVILEEYEIEPEVCMSDLLALLNDLRTTGLIEVKNETVT
ncbi:PqqD family peptide modification chaperone [Mastigocladopsis repens]|uniref:PqqD family peptide modification chaperone n=1 Tax=Mastigocladopsis repens TaxID=221287 RepID=UPI0004745F1D|nr:PqqD family peptide modification chaperone [Mastigocladopsis repens]